MKKRLKQLLKDLQQAEQQGDMWAKRLIRLQGQIDLLKELMAEQAKSE